jgi:predicted N-acyltransferase
LTDDDEDIITAKITNRIAEVDAAAWDACAGDDNPFISHAWLKACEDSESVSPSSGWGPSHLLIEDADGGLSACAPVYLKSHSRGEYIFDYGWADALERAGGDYYPKLLVASPFTPATGPRLLTRPGPEQAKARQTLITALVSTVQHYGVSGLHVNFCEQDEWNDLGQAGFLQRTDQQFHWFNDGYETFEDFLDQLASRKRKTIRKERREALANDIEIQVLKGAEITEGHWDAFYQFYTDTGSRKWGAPYFNRLFFSLIGASMADKIVLFMCKRAGRYIAGAINFLSTDTLFGRYWGCVEDHRFLHFETCYYQAIDYAIQHGLARVEAGAQGPHKIARGYQPVTIYSAHWIEHPGFRRAVADYLEHERREVSAGIDYLADLGPFRKGEKQQLD